MTHRTEPNVSVEYNHANAKAKLSFLGNPFILKGSLTAGVPEYGVGLDGKYNTVTKKFSAYNLAAWWFRKHSRLVAKHVSTSSNAIELGNLEVSYYHKISPKIHIGTRVVNNTKENTTGFEIGGDYKYDENTVLKGKIGTCGGVGMALTRQLNSNLKLTLATGLDSKAITTNNLKYLKFRFKLDYKQ